MKFMEWHRWSTRWILPVGQSEQFAAFPLRPPRLPHLASVTRDRIRMGRMKTFGLTTFYRASSTSGASYIGWAAGRRSRRERRGTVEFAKVKPFRELDAGGIEVGKSGNVGAGDRETTRTDPPPRRTLLRSGQSGDF